MAIGLKEKYKTTVTQSLKDEFQYKNVHEVPRFTKITINRGLGEASQNAKALESSIQELTLITGQKPIVTKAKKSIAGFKIREEVPIGIVVHLRKDKMYSFLEKLINLTLPRIRDFRGISPRSFDGKGNYNLGLREQLIFPEIDYDNIDQIRGLDISIVTTAKTDQEGLALLKKLGMPFRES
uniref:Large ribosomal subunit protein uL5c n=2 Tax=Pyropia yezoensis TaxID=2788 RepID=RK5_PYRYE|nr:ribosomal protein L5 [Neopyropia yezoensis]Q1XDI6.1 RecName: Full=Large ribosomal subunit protein uL5c; AltName: Full=50S ribosomal protein L5, chloroplastic [Neopyropia yezoensis]ABJ91313.1 50S ribosomal protein L5 [Neopyropia yezoensis]AGH27628.1 ribosomal protein L5 [Neopyropia yezoensis]QFZ66964.1 ribosomal protein L5 [Neopyropia yezoensis]ULU28943.1 ribosomal protein L5 [Neopyropia yezoensis]WKD83459.1 ribosomal protein L5 [Neopyropia yezoensis]